MIPRRTGTPPPTAIELGIAVVAPIGTTLCAWFGAWALSQVFWLILAGTMIRFALVRFRSQRAMRKPPNGFVWIPIGFAFGIVGSIMTGIGGMLGQEYWWLHTIGRNLILQGMFIALVLGVGGLAIPLMTRGEAPKDATSTSQDRAIRAMHCVLALALLSSFAIEVWYSLPFAMAIRASIILGVLLRVASLWKRPSLTGWNRWLIWLSAWALPSGYALAAALPNQYKAGLHVSFIGGFAILALSVGAHVILGHGEYKRELFGQPRLVLFIGVLALFAIVFRGMMELDPDRFFFWMTIAAASFLLGTSAWLAFLLPKLRKASESTPSAGPLQISTRHISIP